MFTIDMQEANEIASNRMMALNDVYYEDIISSFCYIIYQYTLKGKTCAYIGIPKYEIDSMTRVKFNEDGLPYYYDDNGNETLTPQYDQNGTLNTNRMVEIKYNLDPSMIIDFFKGAGFKVTEMGIITTEIAEKVLNGELDYDKIEYTNTTLSQYYPSYYGSADARAVAWIDRDPFVKIEWGDNND